MDNAGNALLQMDEDVAASHLADTSCLQTMNISEEMTPKLTEYSTVQRQKNLREEKKILDKQELEWLDRVFITHRQDPAQALQIVHERKDMEPQWRNSMLYAIKTGRIDLEDDTSTVLAMQERMFAGDAPVTNNDFAREISKGNLRVETSKELQTMQHHLNQGERNLVSNALSMLDASFRDAEDFAGNPSRLAARTLYLRTLTKALRENDTQLLVMLTNKNHVEAVGRSFRGIDVAKDKHEINTASEVSQAEEGVVLMERPLIGLEILHDEDKDDYGWVRHEQFFSLKGDYNFGKFKDGGIRSDDLKNRSLYIQKDKRVFKEALINT